MKSEENIEETWSIFPLGFDELRYQLSTSSAGIWWAPLSIINFWAQKSFLDYKLSPCSECFMLSSEWFPGVWIQTPGNYPEESVVWILHTVLSRVAICMFLLAVLLQDHSLTCCKTSALTWDKGPSDVEIFSTKALYSSLWASTCNIRLSGGQVSSVPGGTVVLKKKAKLLHAMKVKVQKVNSFLRKPWYPYAGFSLHTDTTPPQPYHNVTPTHIEPDQYTAMK